MTDVRLYQGENGGEIDYVNGQAVMGDGLEASVYLSLFGGNSEDSGEARHESVQWWGNLSEQDEARKYRSATQYALASLPITSGNLLLVEDAARRDLAWMEGRVATGSLAIVATIPQRNRVEINVAGIIDNEEFSFSFGEPWPGA